MKASRFLLVTILLTILVRPAWSATEVTSITANPDPFNPYEGETTTITVEATPGVDTLKLRVLTDDGYDVVRGGLALTETIPGIYAVTWDGRDSANALFLAGDYVLRVFNLATTTFIGPYAEITVEGLAHDATVPFVPTGTNAVVFTYTGAPGRTGLSLGFRLERYPYTSWQGPDGISRLPLTETSTPGIYTASWNAINYSYKRIDGQYQWVPDSIMRDNTYTIYVYDSAGNQSTTAGQITISGVSSVSASPTQFNAAGGETTTITVSGASGLDLELKISKRNTDGTREVARILPMTEDSAGIYSTEWNGTDESGNLVPVGYYYLQVWHTGSSIPYSPSQNTNIRVSTGTSAITASPDPFNPTGTNAAIITVEATPGQTGLSLGFSLKFPGQNNSNLLISK